MFYSGFVCMHGCVCEHMCRCWVLTGRGDVLGIAAQQLQGHGGPQVPVLGQQAQVTRHHRRPQGHARLLVAIRVPLQHLAEQGDSDSIN